MKRQKVICFLLTLCICFSTLPITAQATIDSRVERAISWAISIANDDSHGYDQTHRNGPDYDCSSLVSTAFRQGGFNVSGSCWTGNMEQAFTAVGFRAYAAGSVTLQRGDILLRHDNVWQHVELYIGNNQCVGAHINENGGVSGGRTGDQTGHEIDVHSTRSCYFCGGGYARVLRYEGNPSGPSTPTVKEYFSCNVQINTAKGKTVNLYSKPTDGSRKTYFDQGQTAYSTRGAKLSDGSTWYEIQAIDNGKVVTLWLNAASSGVNVVNRKVEPSLNFSPSSLSMNVGSSKTVSIKFAGDGIQSLGGTINGQSLCDVSWGTINWNTGTTSLIVTGKKAGKATIAVNLIDKNGKIIYSKSFTATFTDPTYTVSYNANGGSGAPSSQTKTHGKNLTLSNQKPTRSGYTFKGWATSSNSSSVSYQPSGTYSGNNNLTLYAVWAPSVLVEPTLSFSPSSLSMNVGSSKTVSITFKGDEVQSLGGSINGQSLCNVSWGSINWNAGTTSLIVTGKKAGKATITVNLIDKNGKTICSKSFTATFIDPTYTVSYNANGGSGAPSLQTKTQGKDLTLSGQKPIRSGYTFKGWATSSGASSAQYQPGSIYTDDKGLTLYAVWERNKVESSITFSTSSITLDPGTSKTVYITFKGEGIKYLGFTPSNEKNSVCYLSWADINWKNGTTSVTATGKEPGTTAITVYLMDKDENSFYQKSFDVTVQSPSYKVSYDPNGGSGAPTVQTKVYGKELMLSTQKPIRSGYKFNGWSTTPNSSSANYQPGSIYREEGNLTLYAVWVPDSAVRYTVKHYLKDSSGTIHLDAIDELAGTTGTTVSPAPRKYTGYESPATKSAIIQADGSTVIEYTYTVKSYTVTLSAGTGISHISGGGTYPYGSKVTISAVVSDGFQWQGWNSSTAEFNGSTEMNYTFTMPDCNLTFKAEAKAVEQVYEVHLPKQNEYAQGYFQDVYPNQWFTKNVASAYELGLMKGKSNRIFDPYGNVTLAEAITMACRIHSIYINGYENIPQTNGGKWYQQYLDYAYQQDIIDWASYHNANVGGNATRVQFAEIMAKCLPDEGFYAMNAVQDNAIPDMPVSDTSASFVYKLYRAGILSGSDVKGTFSPLSYITRAEAAAIISRVAESDNRVSFSLS